MPMISYWESDRVEELFFFKLSQYTKFTGTRVCNDHLGISYAYERNGFCLNQSNKINVYCKNLQVTKAVSSLSIDFNELKSKVEF